MADEAGALENVEKSGEAVAGFFPDLTGEELALLTSHLELKVFPAGTVISSEGDRPSHAGFLLSGRLSVRKANDFSDRPILVAVLESGSVFGERVFAGPYTADVTLSALEESRVLLLAHERVEELVRDNPTLGVKILTGCLKVSSRRLQGATARIVDIL